MLWVTRFSEWSSSRQIRVDYTQPSSSLFCMINRYTFVQLCLIPIAKEAINLTRDVRFQISHQELDLKLLHLNGYTKPDSIISRSHHVCPCSHVSADSPWCIIHFKITDLFVVNYFLWLLRPNCRNCSKYLWDIYHHHHHHRHHYNHHCHHHYHHNRHHK